MFRRSESARERTLLKLIESLQAQNSDLTDRVMYLTDRPWQVPPAEPKPKTTALERTWTTSPEQEPYQ